MAVILRAIAVCFVLGLAAAVHAQSDTTSETLREANTATLAGDWQRVAQLVDPLLATQLPDADLAEAHRLAGLAAFFQQRNVDAEAHFLAYLRLDLDGRLDPALYPPDVVAFFNDVASRHAAELRARRPRSPRNWVFTLLPPVGQFQNGERGKAYVLGSTLVGLGVTSLGTYLYLNTSCHHTSGPAGGGFSCDRGTERWAKLFHPINIASGIAFWVVYGYGVYDGIRGYRHISREQSLQPYVTVSHDDGGGIIGGVIGHF